MSKTILRSIVVFASVLVLPAMAEVQTVRVFFWADGQLYGVARDLASDADPVTASLRALVAGPTAVEASGGLQSAIPAGTQIAQVQIVSDDVTVEFSMEVVEGLDDLRLESIFRQVRATLAAQEVSGSIKLTAAQKQLSAYLPVSKPVAPGPDAHLKGELLPIPAGAAGSALTGRKITLSPGHGLVWGGSSWGYERPITCSPLTREDLHNIDLVVHLAGFLAQDGATLKNCRCLDYNYGNHSTGNPWWYMSSAYWLQETGYPCSVYSPVSGDCTLGSGESEGTDSLRSRPYASNYDDTDLYISVHTNALAGDCFGTSCPNGTETFYDNGVEHAEWGAISYDLALAVNTNMVNLIRTHYGDALWSNRGAKNSNGAYAEARLPERAAILIELGFHDSCDRDALYLRDRFFQSLTMWGAYKGVCDYLGVSPTYDLYTAEYVSDTIPAEMDPGQDYDVSITFRNRGVLWTEARQIRLGVPEGSDPFYPSNRLYITGEVDTAQTYTFNFTMTAPTEPDVYTTNWRMLRESFTWFGPVFTKQIQVGPPLIPGDLDIDGDVDLDDFGRLQVCLTGQGGGVATGCSKADLDKDGDVDKVDITRFIGCVSGANNPGNVDCLP